MLPNYINYIKKKLLVFLLFFFHLEENPARDLSDPDKTYEIVKILLEANDKERYDDNLLFKLAHHNATTIHRRVASLISSYVYYQ